MTEQTDAAEVEALAEIVACIEWEFQGAYGTFRVEPTERHHAIARAVLASGWLAAREAAAEARGAERALREAAEDPALRLSGHNGISISRLRARTCGDWSAECGNDVPEQWRQHVNAADPSRVPSEEG